MACEFPVVVRQKLLLTAIHCLLYFTHKKGIVVVSKHRHEIYSILFVCTLACTAASAPPSRTSMSPN